jgi:hypothetical protein
MTRDEVLQLPSGAELDHLVAREVMKFEDDPLEAAGGWVDLKDGTCISMAWSPSTNLADALTVLARIGQIDNLPAPDGASRVAIVSADGTPLEKAVEARLTTAVCRAALLSVMKFRD